MPAPRKPHGKILYLLLPARQEDVSASFFQEVFGWTIRETENGITFDDSVGQVHGRFTTQLPVADSPGYVLYIMVANAEETEKRIVEYGGEVIDPADRSTNDILGTFRDPAGNLFGFYEMATGESDR